MEAAVQPVVTWMVNGRAVDTTSDRISTEGDTLTFSPLATSDTGRYTCELTVAEDQRYVTAEAPVQSEEKNIAVRSKLHGKIVYALLHVYSYSLIVLISDVVTTPSHTTPLYAGIGATLTCTHPGGESIDMRCNIPSSLSKNEFSDTGLHTLGNIYTRNITISPLLIRHSG